MAEEKTLTAEEVQKQYGIDLKLYIKALTDKKITVASYQKIFTVPKTVRPKILTDILAEVGDKKKREEWELPNESTTLEDWYVANKAERAEFLKGGFSKFLEMIPDIAQKMVDSGLDFLNDKSAEIGKKIFDYLIDSGLIPEDMGRGMEQLIKEKPALALPSIFVFITVAFGGWAKATIGAILLKTEREANKKFLTNIPDFHEFLPLALYDENAETLVKKLMAETGIPEEYYFNYKEGSKRRFGMAEIFALKWRGEIDDNEAKEYFEKAGYTDSELIDTAGLAYNIPGIQDLVLMAVREAFRDDVAKEFGYDDEYPQEIEKFVTAQGYDADWLLRYWRAHWTIPSIQQGFEMLHRRVIDTSELDTMLRVQDIPTFWREKLLQISYHPYSRIDVRRLYRTGVLDEQQVYDNYLDLGYDKEHAFNLTKFTVLDARQDERDASKAEIIKAFHSDIITDREAEKFLNDMGYDKEAVELIMAVEVNKKEDRLIKRKINVVKKNYVNGVTDATKARDLLSKLEVPTENVKLLLEEWDIDIAEDQKIPTKADLSKLYKKNIITQDEYTEQMILLGFSTKYIDWFLQLIDKGMEVE
jgi:hypothetical protein